eukprot:7578798-Pyramimonas_sp.AAC.1
MVDKSRWFRGVSSQTLTVASPSDHPDGWTLRPHLGTKEWQHYEEGSEQPDAEDPGVTPGFLLLPLGLPQAEYSALCGGRLVRAILSERGWMGVV